MVADQGPDVAVIALVPEQEATGVPLTQTIRAQLDRFPSPYAILRQSACFRSFAPNVQGCIGSEVVPEIDPVDRIGVWRIPSLSPGLRYEGELRAPQDDPSGFGIRAFDGAPLHHAVQFGFETSRTDVASAEPLRSGAFCTAVACALPTDGCSTATPEPLTTSGAREVLRGCAAIAGCHQRADAKGASPSRLVLEGDAIAGAIGHVALPVAKLPDPRSVDRTGSDFPLGMPWIDPGNPANSYLLYVMIVALPDAEATREPYAHDLYACASLPPPVATGSPCTAPAPTPTAGPVARAGDSRIPAAAAWIDAASRRAPSSDEVDRLAARLPTDRGPHRGRVTWDDARSVGPWIAAGASTSCAE